MAIKGVNNLAKVADMIMKKGRTPGPKVFTEDEYKELHSNGLGLVCQTSQKINSRRVSLVGNVPTRLHSYSNC